MRCAEPWRCRCRLKITVNLDAKAEGSPPNQTDVGEMLALYEHLVGVNGHIVSNDQFLCYAVDDERQTEAKSIG